MPAKTTHVKKVKAYPIPVALKNEALQMSGAIMKLADLGFLAELSSGLVAAGDKFDFTFELPVSHKMISGQGVVVKVYNQFSGATGSLITAEIHYRVLSNPHRADISNFVRAVSGQSGGSTCA